MPLGKYYYDYCDKQFQDTPATRKHHLQGLQLFSQLPYFLLFIHMFVIVDLYQTSVPPFLKGVCNRFLNTDFASTEITVNTSIPTMILGPQILHFQLHHQVRHCLRKDHGIEGGIPVVFSLEKPKAKLLPFRGPSGEEDNPSDYQVRMLASYFSSFKVLCLIT
ncbi:hypothetical protein ES319_D01G177400v1 [Gossypium barbadense]|uniref:Uncharacterized protein n=3 Tax=Gossypium TaxID=3633 RepID=A0A5J5SQP1_GOSBA|nr:hypothetical protein ES319_D01G177400v1 [Gossypium barbadense]TYG83732.1 hypothetical protein ES288_D01G191300v1 [Gossypium darwinii]TYH88540.1 hypothetical protein ES332_D01G194100v1 [Gossypium tomentosum]